MEKPYDLKDLGAKVKAEASKRGLELAESAVEELSRAVYFGFKDWAKESAALSENKIDDLAAKFYDYADEIVLPQISKIDLDGTGA